MSKARLDALVQSRNFVARLSLDTSGRKGKAVTVVDGLPKNELFLKELVKILKNRCGAGGSHLMDQKDGVIHLQGDHRDRVRTMLAEFQIKTKG